jgi:hypothetical protein
LDAFTGQVVDAEAGDIAHEAKWELGNFVHVAVPVSLGQSRHNQIAIADCLWKKVICSKSGSAYLLKLHTNFIDIKALNDVIQSSVEPIQYIDNL